MNEAIVKLENISKIYQLGSIELQAIKGISLEINRGSFMAIMGASGSGKSTLLNMIGCLDSPTKGKVFLKGKDVSLLSEDQLSQLRGKTIGFIFQEFNLLPNLNSLDNVALPMVFQGLPEIKRRERAKNLLFLVGLKDRIFHQPTELSGGEKQRVAIARALANDPELIIADEPTGNLDSVTGKKVMEILSDFHKKEKKTIIIVTHDINIANYTEEIFNIKDGEELIDHK